MKTFYIKLKDYKLSLLLKVLFKEYASKAPVNIPGPQIKANRAAKRLWSHLTEQEQRELTIERAHALTGEGREKFDATCQKIQKRLFG